MMVEKQYSVDFFNSAVESLQRACQTLISFNHVVDLSGYLALEIDNVKKERFVLSEFVQSSGNVISESFCTKAWRTGLTVQRQHQPRQGNNASHPTASVYGNSLHPNENRVPQRVQQNRTGYTQMRKNPVKQEPSSYTGNKATSSTVVNRQYGQGKQVFNSNPPVQNPMKKLPLRHPVGPAGQKDNTPHLQNVQSSMKQNHQVEHGRIVVKSERDIHMGPIQTGISHSGKPSNSFGQAKVDTTKGSIGQGHPLQATEIPRTTLGTNAKGSFSESQKMLPPMQPPPASTKSEKIPRKQLFNPWVQGGSRKNIQKHLGQEAPSVKAGPKLTVISSCQTQPAKQNVASMPQEVTKENVPQEKVATSKDQTRPAKQNIASMPREITKENVPQDKVATSKAQISEVSSACLLGEHGTMTNAPEKLQVSKSESRSFAIADVRPILSKLPTMTKCTASHSDAKVVPHIEQMEPLLRPLSPIVVINSLSSSLYKLPRVTVMSTTSITDAMSRSGPVFPTSDIEWEVPSITPARTSEETDDNMTNNVNPSPLTTTSLAQPNITETKPVTSGHEDQGLSNSSKMTLEDVCLGPPAKHPKLSGNKTKEKAVKKQTNKGRRKSSYPRKADHCDVSTEFKDISLPVQIGPTNRTLRSAANPVRRNYSEEQECENETTNTDTNAEQNVV